MKIVNRRLLNFRDLLPAILAGLVFLPAKSYGHCDGLDGPVVTAARAALKTGDVNRVLIWVQEKDEPEIRKIFKNALAVRKQGPQAKDLAETAFFETVVRVHRAGEGEPFSGLKPAGRALGPVIPAADRALERGSVVELNKLLVDSVQEGLRHRFQEVLSKKTFKPENVSAGRDYVRAYVEFIHYADGLYRAATEIQHGQNEDEPGDR